MKKMKMLILIFVMLMSIFLLAGCADDNAAAKNGSSGSEVQEEVQSEGALDEEAAEAAQSAAEQYNDGDIGADAVKAIVLAKVSGATEADISEFEIEYDDGRLEYEGSIYYGGYEYEFEIDGATGNILAWEIDD